jgi:transcriptional regulator with XRE-family HTH domain/tetratricopeptide (TPR) repeat protein
MKKNNTMLQSARIKKSWTPEFVSKKVGVSLNTYIRWETGIQVPRPSSLSALCNVFEMTPTELGFADLSSEKKNGIDTVPGSQDEQASDGPLTHSSQSEALALWSSGITSCWQLYMVGSQTELERLVPTYLTNLIRPTLRPGPDQPVAARLTAQAYQLLTLLELQRGDFVAAQKSSTQALIYSQLSKDWNLYVASQLRLAAVFSARKRVGSALSSYNDALYRITATSDNISPILHSWIFAGLSEIQASMGREKEALQFLQLAFAVFPDEPENDPSFSYTRCDRSLLYLYEGLIFLRLGQPKVAWDAFSQVDDLKPAPPERIRTEFLHQKAYTSCLLGNIVQSCIYLEAAARAAQEIESDLAFSEVYALYTHMLSLWGQETRVKALAQLFQQ